MPLRWDIAQARGYPLGGSSQNFREIPFDGPFGGPPSPASIPRRALGVGDPPLAVWKKLCVFAIAKTLQLQNLPKKVTKNGFATRQGPALACRKPRRAQREGLPVQCIPGPTCRGGHGRLVQPGRTPLGAVARPD